MSEFPPTGSGSVLARPTTIKFSTTLAGASGHELKLDGQWRPVIGLGEGVLRGQVLHLEVRESIGGGSFRPVELRRLNAIDLERLDIAAAEHGLAALPEAPPSDHPPLAFLPINFGVARTPRARRRLLTIAAQAQVRLKILPVAELHGLESGTPSSAVREIAGALQPIFRGALIKLAPNRASITEVLDCGLTGAAVEAGDLAEAADAEAMLRTVLFLQRVGPSVMLHSLRSVAALMAAKAAGARWASLDLQRSGAHLANAALEAMAQN